MMKNLNSLIRLLLSIALLVCSSIEANAQQISSADIDKLVERTMKTFDVPGIAVAVVKDGKVIHSRGYGVSSLITMQKTDENTLFAIASNSKAFTSAALGILIDEGKLKWNDLVTDYIPEFKMYNPYVTEEFTIKDLLTHRSGLGLGAGDLMVWPDSSDFTLKDIIHNLRYLKPVSGFRTKYDYDNLLYIVAGEVVARASGMSWEEFVENRIMLPLGMNRSAACYRRLKDKTNVIDAHVEIDGKVQAVPMLLKEIANSAGGIYSSVADMSKWAIMQMNDGKYGEGLSKQIFSQEVHQEIWTPQTIIPVMGKTIYNTHFQSYGLGWRLSDVSGFKQVTHTGGLSGVVTQVTLIPDLQLGIIVFTNQQTDAAFTAITNTIKDSYFGIVNIDRVKENYDRVRQSAAEAGDVTGAIWKKVDEMAISGKKPADLNIFTGIYTDNWFGDVDISLKDGKLWFASKRSPKLCGEMFYFGGETFIVKWRDRSFDADAFVKFELDFNGRPSGIKMKAVSPLTDFSYDFQDLDFRRSM
ncbi:MAG: serine hydrolase [Rikenellaceae bacterium]